MRFKINPATGLDDLYSKGRASKRGRKLDKSIVAAFARRIALIKAIPDERDLYQFKGLRFEKLDRNDEDHSIRLNDQFRLIVAFREDSEGRYMWVDEIEDYH